MSFLELTKMQSGVSDQHLVLQNIPVTYVTVLSKIITNRKNAVCADYPYKVE